MRETRESEVVEHMDIVEVREPVLDMVEGTGDPDPKLESNEASEVCDSVREERLLEKGDGGCWRPDREWQCFNILHIEHHSLSVEEHHVQHISTPHWDDFSHVTPVGEYQVQCIGMTLSNYFSRLELGKNTSRDICL